ncbi:MAG TPA: hypothetical protein VFL86_24060 [Burkholderiaceae bacterium]|nr:hypothetical protein [Burkholderiaceae bacterium]
MNAALGPAVAVDDPEAGSSQTVRAQVRLRELIVGGVAARCPHPGTQPCRAAT